MTISVEISFYPLREEFLRPISDFIDRLEEYEALFVRVNGMSSHVVGEYDDVMGAIKNEMKASLEIPHSVFVMKVLNTDLRNIEK